MLENSRLSPLVDDKSSLTRLRNPLNLIASTSRPMRLSKPDP